MKASSQSSTPPATWQGQGGAVVYYYVDDIKSTLQTLVDAGAEVDTDVQDVGGGRQIAAVKDADGNLIGLLQDA